MELDLSNVLSQILVHEGCENFQRFLESLHPPHIIIGSALSEWPDVSDIACPSRMDTFLENFNARVNDLKGAGSRTGALKRRSLSHTRQEQALCMIVHLGMGVAPTINVLHIVQTSSSSCG